MNKSLVAVTILMLSLGATPSWAGAAPIAVPTPRPEPVTTQPLPFGYDIFVKGQIQEVREGPVDRDYLVGPGDELLIETWGDYTRRYPLMVSEDGWVDLEAEELRILVNGLTIRQIEEKVLREMANVHATFFDWQNPTKGKAWVSVTPMRVRNILVYVAGEVMRPGTFSISSAVASLINVLTNAGGLKPAGSLRHIRVSRADGKVEDFDLYGFLLRGETKAVSVRLKSGETIFVGLKQKSVTVRGHVKRPAIYEMLDDESLADAIKYAGGPAPGAYLKRIQITRRAPNEGKRTLDIDFVALQDGGTTFPLLDGDIVEIFPAVEEEYVVKVMGGGIYRNGVFQFTQGMTVAELIEKAEGLRGQVYLDKADLIRTRMDYTKEYRSFSLTELYRKNPLTGKVEIIGDITNPANWALQRLDEIVIYSYFEMIGKDKMVTLEGNVKEPGNHLLAEKMKLSDLLFAHGGFEDIDWRRATYLERADLIRTMPEDLSTTIIAVALRRVLNGEPGADLELQSMDRVVIYSYDEIVGTNRYVHLEGHVKQPGDHQLSENMHISDLLFAYGGFEDEDFKKATYLERADLFRTNPENLGVAVMPIDLRKVLAGDAAADIRLQSLDRLIVYEFQDFHPDAYFTIQGAVRQPGRHVLAQNTTLSDAIMLAHGLLDEAYKYEAEIVRTSPADVSVQEPAKVFRVAISENYAGEPREKGFRLAKDDVIFIRTVPGWEKPRTVRIAGEVKFAGEYVLTKAGERLSDLVGRADGLKETAYMIGAVFTRLRDEAATGSERVRVTIDLARALAKPKSDRDLLLRNGDELQVPTNPMTIEVRGAVPVPAVLQYRQGSGVSEYIRLCGGYREDAVERQTLLVNPDGTTTRLGWRWFEPQPLPGSIIAVPSSTVGPEGIAELLAPAEKRPPAPAGPPWPWWPPTPEGRMTTWTLEGLWPTTSPWALRPGAPMPTSGDLFPFFAPGLPEFRAAVTTGTRTTPPVKLPIP